MPMGRKHLASLLVLQVLPCVYNLPVHRQRLHLSLYGPCPWLSATFMTLRATPMVIRPVVIQQRKKKQKKKERDKKKRKKQTKKRKKQKTNQKNGFWFLGTKKLVFRALFFWFSGLVFGSKKSK